MKKVFAILALLLSCSFLYGKSLTIFKYKEKYGVINEKKEVVILPEYDSIKMSSKGLICKTIQEDFTKYSIFDTKGLLIYYSDRASLPYFVSDNYVAFIDPTKGKGYQILNLESHQLLSTDSSSKISSGSDDSVPLYPIGKAYFKKDFSKVGIKPLFLDIKPFREGYASVHVKEGNKPGLNSADTAEDRYYFINSKGKKVLGPFRHVSDFISEGIFAVYTLDGRIGFMNVKGEYLFSADLLPTSTSEETPSYNYEFHDGYVVTATDGPDSIKIFNTKGIETKKPANFSSCDPTFSQGLLGFSDKETNLWGFMNGKGKVIVPCIYKKTSPFQGDFASVELQNEEGNVVDGIIDRKGKFYSSESLVNPVNIKK